MTMQSISPQELAMRIGDGEMVVGPLFTPEDVDSRTGERRLLEDDYRLHADHVDTVRLALMAQRDQFLVYLDSDVRMGARKSAAYWVGELWAIERACRALGINS